ncbi:MAG: carbon-nitrogen hydrolase family protein [Candidatus Sumerlaeia bacterium]|nr:carbon-nitrogen hydrolase family protein [Candidatus Sumerlaeia bacterium]
MKTSLMSLLSLSLLMGCQMVSAASPSNNLLAPEYNPMTPEQIGTQTARVAAVQITGPWMWRVPPTEETDPATLLVPYIEKAASDGADLVVFPELYLGMFRVPSPQSETISTAARENNINVIVGCFEVFDDEGNYGNSTLIFDRAGEIVGRFYKIYQAVGETPRGWPPVPHDPEWMMVPGEELPVFDLDFGRIGILTCYDGYFPELFRTLSLKGAEIIIWPNARGGALEDYIALSNSHHNYTHMVATNKAIGAGTMIAQWPPKILERVEEPVEAYIVADLDMAHLRTARIHSREFHQIRPHVHSEIMKPWEPWKHYGAESPDPNIPEPDHDLRREILRGLGISYTESASE